MDTRSETPFAPFPEDFRQTMVYITVFLFSSYMVTPRLDFVKKHAIIRLEALLFLFNFEGGSYLRRPKPPWYTHVFSPLTMS